jgi:hypothetical protein
MLKKEIWPPMNAMNADKNRKSVIRVSPRSSASAVFEISAYQGSS